MASCCRADPDLPQCRRPRIPSAALSWNGLWLSLGRCGAPLWLNPRFGLTRRCCF